ncbi:MAG: metallophosphoesterase [Candidatus Omnitrophica bacterium]|nr:metallophosphoesterase [Candidatus Omnitrophota bacterium]
MILGIIADSHDNLPKLKKAIALFNKKNVNLVLHAGDYIAPFSVGMLENNLNCEYLGVFGNNDGERNGLVNRSQGKINNETLELDKFNRKIFLVHDINKVNIDFSNYDILICGHTHKVKVDRHNHTWLINPGECGGWLSGKSSVATFDLISNTVKIHRL